MNTNNIVEVLQHLINEIESGSLVCDQISITTPVKGVDKWDRSIVNYQHNGRKTVILELHSPEKVAAFNKVVSNALIPGIPAYMQNPVID